MVTSLQRNAVSPNDAYAVIDEKEPTGDGTVVDVTTIFLTASECPIGCSMCDLWQNTLTTPTPAGAIVTQITKAIKDRQRGDWIKLYNSGNFFDPQSIPPDDYAAIADQCKPYSRVIVENHPKFGERRMHTFRDLIDAQLEIAVGLETVQPRWLDRLNKQMSRDDFDKYAGRLFKAGIDLRVFLIVGVPGVSSAEAIKWARLSVRHACHVGARHISLIPARQGHGWNGRADELPQVSLSELDQLHQSAIEDTAGASVVTVDLWDIGKPASAAENEVAQQIAMRNLSQQNMANVTVEKSR